MRLLQIVYNAAETGQVSCTPSKERTTYKLDSPVGVNANLLFTRNFSGMGVNGQEEEAKWGDAVGNLQAGNQEDSDEEYEEQGVSGKRVLRRNMSNGINVAD
mmetsp:Transcript_28879/g.52235  ORF Transcript_28879/g.52235 Transcript_28879/m.52235 type:complete len:102 (+) Transcript_28879:450-755(+)